MSAFEHLFEGFTPLGSSLSGHCGFGFRKGTTDTDRIPAAQFPDPRFSGQNRRGFVLRRLFVRGGKRGKGKDSPSHRNFLGNVNSHPAAGGNINGLLNSHIGKTYSMRTNKSSKTNEEGKTVVRPGALIRSDKMYITPDISREEIKKLKKGDTFMGSEIVNLQQKNNLISIVTRNGDVFNIHKNHPDYRVFKKNTGIAANWAESKEEGGNE
jgi:hypothetical protein